MRAIVQDAYGAPHVLAVRSIDKPAVAAGSVLVRVRAAGVDAGVWHVVAGQPYLLRILGYGLRKPKVRVPGTDLAGHVEEVGRDVTRFRPGDEVLGLASGAFAEYACVREDRLVAKPSRLSFEQAAAVPVSALTALQGLRDAGQLKPGQRVLVTGAGGGVGTFAVQIARALGAVVTGACSAARTDLVRSIGAERAIDHAREDFTDGRSLHDLILDTAGRRPLTRLRRALTPRGTLVIVGGEGGGRWLGGADRQLRALLLSPFVGQRLVPFLARAKQGDLVALTELIEAGQLTPVVDRSYPLSEAAEALRYLHEARARGKVVLTL